MNLGSMQGPVIAYILVISLMVNRALSTLVNPAVERTAAWIVSIGGVLFYVSDVILAAIRFWKPWKYHRLSLAFSYGGQTLIALSASKTG